MLSPVSGRDLMLEMSQSCWFRSFQVLSFVLTAPFATILNSEER
jgi:hypothetical protein